MGLFCWTYNEVTKYQFCCVSTVMTGRFKGLRDGQSKPGNQRNVAFCLSQLNTLRCAEGRTKYMKPDLGFGQHGLGKARQGGFSRSEIVVITGIPCHLRASRNDDRHKDGPNLVTEIQPFILGTDWTYFLPETAGRGTVGITDLTSTISLLDTVGS